MMRIWKEFRFEAAHFLPNLPASHKCARMHGHSYRFRLHIAGTINPTTGWVTDFGGVLRAAGELVCADLDHRTLNEIDGLANPTAEHLAVWIWDRVSVTVLGGQNTEGFRLVAVEVLETRTAGVIYEGAA